jgi:hypothetical protein
VISVVAAQKAHAILAVYGFQSGETLSTLVPVFLTLPELSPLQRLSPFHLRGTVRADVAQPAKNRSA